MIERDESGNVKRGSHGKPIQKRPATIQEHLENVRQAIAKKEAEKKAKREAKKNG